MAHGQLYIPLWLLSYTPHPSHGLRTDLTSLNPVLITPWFQSILVLKAEFSGLLSSPDAPLCQPVDPTYRQPWFAISDPYEFLKNIYCLSYSYIEILLILFHLLHFYMKMKPSHITLALSELLFLLSEIYDIQVGLELFVFSFYHCTGL